MLRNVIIEEDVIDAFNMVVVVIDAELGFDLLQVLVYYLLQIWLLPLTILALLWLSSLQKNREFRGSVF